MTNTKYFAVDAKKLKLIDCPECRGRGQFVEGRSGPQGHIEVMVDCELCYGEGCFEEADYLIMRLEGKV
jgi:DnaJ-class molecular chaperone